MRQPIFVRPFTEEEQQRIETGLRSSDAFVLRRSQILLASARGERVPSIARALSCDEQTVRNAIHAFNQKGPEALQASSSRPQHLRTALEGVDADAFKARLAPSSARLWLRDEPLDAFVGRQSVCQARLDRQPGQRRDHSPDPQTLGDQLETSQALDYQPRSAVPSKKNARDRLITWASQQPGWAIGFLDEVWWSRFALPRLHAWQDREHPVRLVEQSWQKNDPDPKAFACYGVLWQQGPVDEPMRRQMSLRFVTGRPVSEITTQFLEWCCRRLQAQGKTAWLLIWDNASFHVSKMVRTWIREHNSTVKQEGKGVRILPCFLPTKSPWLNPIEPKWVHAKRAVVERDGLLSAKQLAERICTYFNCCYEPHLSIPEKVS